MFTEFDKPFSRTINGKKECFLIHKGVTRESRDFTVSRGGRKWTATEYRHPCIIETPKGSWPIILYYYGNVCRDDEFEIDFTLGGDTHRFKSVNALYRALCRHLEKIG